MPRKTTSPAPKVFTGAFLKKLAVPRDKKDIVLFDDGTGLGVRKTDRGVISFLIQIRLRDGRRWRETFKTSWPTLTIAAARDALKVRAAGLALGVDPFEEREAATAEREASREAGCGEGQGGGRRVHAARAHAALGPLCSRPPPRELRCQSAASHRTDLPEDDRQAGR